MLECALQLRPGPEGIIQLSFLLRNNGREAVAFAYFHPFLDFHLDVEAEGGHPLWVEAPEYDIAVIPKRVDLPAGETLTLHTPATLRFALDENEELDSFIWVIHCPPQAVAVTAALTLEGVEPCKCRAQWPE